MKMIRWILCGLLLSLDRAGAESPKHQDNWHQWRGPLASGFAPTADPPIQWNEATNLKWKVPLPGRGSSTPIVWGDKVFVLTAVKTERTATAAEVPKVDPRLEKKTQPPTNYYQFIVLGFDRSTGKEIWRKIASERVPHEGHHPSHSYAAGSPTTDGRHLFVSFGSFGNFCFDLQGNLVWQRDLGRLNTRFGWGEAVTPVLHGDAVLLNWDQEEASALYCLDAATGKTRWTAPREEKTSWNTPLVVTHEGKTQVVVNGTNKIRGYDLATGNVIWECGGMTVNAIPSAVADASVIYCMSGYRGAAGCAIAAGATGDITARNDVVLWRTAKGTPYVPSPLLVGDRLYFTQANSALLTILDTKTGTPRLDRQRLPNQKDFYASPVAAAGRIYLVDRYGTTLVLKHADKFEVLATNRLDDAIDASPALVGKELFLRSEGLLYCIAEPGTR